MSGGSQNRGRKPTVAPKGEDLKRRYLSGFAKMGFARDADEDESAQTDWRHVALDPNCKEKAIEMYAQQHQADLEEAQRVIEGFIREDTAADGSWDGAWRARGRRGKLNDE